MNRVLDQTGTWSGPNGDGEVWSEEVAESCGKEDSEHKGNLVKKTAKIARAVHLRLFPSGKTELAIGMDTLQIFETSLESL